MFDFMYACCLMVNVFLHIGCNKNNVSVVIAIDDQVVIIRWSKQMMSSVLLSRKIVPQHSLMDEESRSLL